MSDDLPVPNKEDRICALCERKLPDEEIVLHFIGSKSCRTKLVCLYCTEFIRTGKSKQLA